MLVLIYTTQSIQTYLLRKTSKDRLSLPVVNLDKARVSDKFEFLPDRSAVIEKQVLAFGKSEKSELINIGIFAASSGGRKGRRHIGRFTPDRERSHV